MSSNPCGISSAIDSATWQTTARVRNVVPNVVNTEQHSWTVCPSTALNCPNCHGKQAANDRSCPRYKQEEQVLKIKSSRNVSYTEAVKMHLHRNSAQGLSSSNLSSRSELPPLPTVDLSS